RDRRDGSCEVLVSELRVDGYELPGLDVRAELDDESCQVLDSVGHGQAIVAAAANDAPWTLPRQSNAFSPVRRFRKRRERPTRSTCASSLTGSRSDAFAWTTWTSASSPPTRRSSARRGPASSLRRRSGGSWPPCA